MQWLEVQCEGQEDYRLAALCRFLRISGKVRGAVRIARRAAFSTLTEMPVAFACDCSFSYSGADGARTWQPRPRKVSPNLSVVSKARCENNANTHPRTYRQVFGQQADVDVEVINHKTQDDEVVVELLLHEGRDRAVRRLSFPSVRR